MEDLVGVIEEPEVLELDKVVSLVVETANLGALSGAPNFSGDFFTLLFFLNPHFAMDPECLLPESKDYINYQSTDLMTKRAWLKYNFHEHKTMHRLNYYSAITFRTPW